MKHHLFMAERRRNFPNSSMMLRGKIKGRFQTGKDVWQGSKVPIANTFGEFAEMDFSDYVGFAKFLRIRDTFRVSRLLSLLGAEKKADRTEEMVRGADFEFVSGVWGAGYYRHG